MLDRRRRNALGLGLAEGLACCVMVAKQYAVREEDLSLVHRKDRSVWIRARIQVAKRLFADQLLFQKPIKLVPLAHPVLTFGPRYN